MVAVAFGQCGSALFFGGAVPWSKVLTTAVILTVVAVNVTGARFVDRMRNTVVVVLLSVVAVFAAVALDRYAPVADSSAVAIQDGVALTFLAAVAGSTARVGGTRGRVLSVVIVLLLANLVDLAVLALLGTVVVLVISVVTVRDVVR